LNMVKAAWLFFAVSLSVGRLAAAKIPQIFVDTVVALGRSEPRDAGQPSEWFTEASGFLYGYPADNETDPAKHRYWVYLVTNRHVLANHSQILVRMNAEKATDLVQEFTLSLKDDAGADLWVSHPTPSIDLSVMRINAEFLRKMGLQSTFFSGDKHVADRAKMKDIGLSIGDEVFVLGFPMGLSGTAQRNYVIARRGSIARLSDVFESAATTFLIDSLVFPGNSGGPVISVPNLTAIEGTKSQGAAYLVGVVRGYLPYRDVAVSQQTGEVRMITQENSGLAEVIPVDYIDETIRAAKAAESKRLAPPKQ
jgi:S1-C subfamily serine protease